MPPGRATARLWPSKHRASPTSSVQGEVTRAYRRLQADLATVTVVRSLQGTISDFVEATESRLRTGGAKYLDVLRARAEAARLENDRIGAERSLRGDRHALNTLLARSVDEPLDPADSLIFVPLRDSLAEVLVAARETRPRLRAARLKVEREQAAASQARSALLPSPELSFGYDRVPGISRPGIGGAVSVSLPFMPWTDRRARIEETSAARGAAQADLESSERNLERGSLRQAFLIILNVPFALVGGVIALFLSGQNLSVAASVGFIALFGVAVLNGVVMVSYFNQLRREGATLEEAILKGGELRLRPVLMTALVASLGLIPLLFATGPGSEIQRPLAIVVVGGLVTSTLLTLFVLPILYRWFQARETAS